MIAVERLRELRDQFHELAVSDPYSHGFGEKTLEYLLIEAAVFGESQLIGVRLTSEQAFAMRGKYILTYVGDGYYDIEW